MTRSKLAAATAHPSGTAGNDVSGVAERTLVRAKIAAHTDVGRVRKRNEDSVLVADLDLGALASTTSGRVSGAGLLFAVCDGMGGAPAGDVASQLATKALLETLRCPAPEDLETRAKRLVDAVVLAGYRIADNARAEPERRGMGTTATVATLVDDLLLVAQVGDSRAYVFRAGRLVQITKDQTLVNLQVEAGLITKAQGATSRQSNIILQALGTRDDVWVDLTFLALRRGDRLLICSDGLTGALRGNMIRDIMLTSRDPSTCGERLIRSANAAGGKDNITTIVCDFDGEGLRAPSPNEFVGYEQYPMAEARVPAACSAALLSRGVSGYRALGPLPPQGVRRLLVGLLAFALTVVAYRFIAPIKRARALIG